MVDSDIVEKIQQYLACLQAQGLEVSFAVLFGSHVNGTSDAWSDIDVLIVASRFDKPIQRKDINLLWRVAARTDSRIEPIPCGLVQWTQDTSRAIIEIARREGSQILPAA